MGGSDDTWGFVGLGEMGMPMAQRLLDRAIDVIAYDPDPGRVGLAVSSGAVAASMDELGRAAFVSICVRDAAQLEPVLDSFPRGRGVVLIHSTVGREACLEACSRFAVLGWAVIDAPISGMKMAAEAGTLAFSVGGEASVLARARHALDAIGRVSVLVGGLGAGQVAKIANNLVASGSAAFVHEEAELDHGCGVSEHRLLEALSHGSARGWAVENWPFLRHEWIHSQPAGVGAVRDIVAKDLALAVAAAAEAGVDAPFAALAEQTMPGVLASG
jgi:3-hydroxyisobutyrate dehydrogenase